MQRIFFQVVGKRVCHLWLPVGVVWRVLCQDVQLIKLLAQMQQEIRHRGAIFLTKQVISITRERGITCG